MSVPPPFRPRPIRWAAGLLGGLIVSSALADLSLLNVSYDVSRELYKDLNPAFTGAWKGKGGEGLSINQSHGGSSKQVQSVVAGLEADVVTMNQPPDIDVLLRGGLVAADQIVVKR